MEELSQSLDSSTEYVGGRVLAEFIHEANGPQAPAILAWCREHPKLVAMLASLRDDDDLDAALQAIQLPEIREDDDSVVTVQPTYDVTIQAYCLTGLAHGADAKAGNATLFRRRAVITETGRHLYLPVYAGNALRGKMLADHLVRSLGLDASRQSRPWLCGPSMCSTPEACWRAAPARSMLRSARLGRCVRMASAICATCCRCYRCSARRSATA